MRFFRSFISIVACVLTAGFGLAPYAAQALSLRPAIIELSADPGKEARGTVEVANDDTQTKVFQISVQRFLPADDAGRQIFLPPEERVGLPSWIHVSSTVQLRAGESQRVPFSIRPPANAPSGGYYVALFFTAQEGTKDDAIAVGSRTGSLIFFTVHGDAHADVRVESFRQDRSRTWWWPERFEVRLRNEGTVHASPRGFIAIHNLFGQTSHLLPLNAEGARVLPQSSRTIPLPWIQETAGMGFWSRVRQEWNQFGVGFYRAEIVWAEESVGSVAPLSFMIFPWHLGLIVMALLCVLVGLWRWQRRSRDR